ncbi:MAG: zinc ribbon domain-containing protein [Spirochaetes bacterium]|nr:zinc ribbon domain-containing protein [Spirochaetota bacterium]
MIFGRPSGIVPPGPGQRRHYLCRVCGERFTAKVPMIFDIGIKKCPKCGSFKVSRDPIIMH